MSKKSFPIANIIFTVLLSALFAYKIVKMLLNPEILEWLFGSIDENFHYPTMIPFTIAIYLAYSAPYIMPILTIITLWLRDKPKMIMSLITLLVSGSLFVWEFICCGFITIANQLSPSQQRIDYTGYEPMVSFFQLILLLVIMITNIVKFFRKPNYAEWEARLWNK